VISAAAIGSRCRPGDVSRAAGRRCIRAGDCTVEEVGDKVPLSPSPFSGYHIVAAGCCDSPRHQPPTIPSWLPVRAAPMSGRVAGRVVLCDPRSPNTLEGVSVWSVLQRNGGGMSYNTPAETAELAVASGTTKAALGPAKALVGGFLAGAYIAFGGLLAIVASAGLKADVWGGLVTVVTGVTFSLGLVLVVIGGAELLTGNMMLVPMAVLRRRTTIARLAGNWALLFVGNFLGSLFVAYFLAYRTGVIGSIAAKAGTPAASNYARLAAITVGKAVTESNYEVFLRAVGCNWLVCLGVWLAFASRDIPGKILGIILPITAFVALGFDHVVANMFFLPLAMFAHVPGVTATHLVSNLVFAFLGNAVGAALFVGGGYWYLYLHGKPETPTTQLATTTAHTA